MITFIDRFRCLGLFLACCAPAFSTVTVPTLTPSLKSPQPIGTAITWTATSTDSNAGPLTFQFNVTPPHGTVTLVKDFNVGSLSSGTWTSKPFVWVPTGLEGVYTIQVVAKDFTSGEAASFQTTFRLSALATGTDAVVVPTANPLVALFSTPACVAGSTMRVVFQQQSGAGQQTGTNWVGCHPPATMTFEIAGMLPGTAYSMYAQTKTGANITTGATKTFQTGALPNSIPFPVFRVKVADTADTANTVLLHNMIQPGGGATVYPDLATDPSGNVIWYYYPNDTTHGNVLARPLQGGGFLTMQDDYAWDPKITQEQMLRQIDLAGNIVRETNIGVLQQQLLAMKSPAGGPCPTNPVVGSACIGGFHHDAIQTLPNGYTAVLVDEEKIFPPGTQGDTSGLPVDIIGDMILVLDTNWQLVWYWDVFDPKHGGNGYNKLPVTRTAVLSEYCGASSPGCPPIFMLVPNVTAPQARDWLHANTLYYWPSPQNGGKAGDIVWSARHQDWVFRIDYRDGAGTGDIIWRMGPGGDFTFVNTYNDPWPWFSHQHDTGFEHNGSGVMTIFDNGNTRISNPSASTGGVPGLGSGCKPNDCNSRGMALTVDQKATPMTVTPVVSFDLGNYSAAMGSAQLLSNGNYFFENPLILITLSSTAAYSLEIGPTPPAPQAGPANFLLNLAAPEHYRGWQMPSLYYPPTT